MICWSIDNSVDFHPAAAVYYELRKKLKNKLPLMMQILGIVLFIAGNFYDLIPFLIGSLTGLKLDLQW